MKIQVSGKNIDTGAAFQEHALSSLENIVNKYFANAIAGYITLEKGLAGFTVRTRVSLTRRIELESTGHNAKDAHAALDDAIAHAEKRLRRHKRRLRNHRVAITDAETSEMSVSAPMMVYQSANHADIIAEDADTNEQLPVVAELFYEVSALSVEEAVMQLELSDQPCVMFRNAGHLGLNMVYHRKDGTIGWVDPRGSRNLKL